MNPGAGRSSVGSAAMYPVIYRDVRRARVRRFRYAIFYVLEPDAVAVLAVLHEARSPDRWPGR